MTRKLIAAALIALGLTIVIDRAMIGQAPAELFMIIAVWIIAIFWVVLDPTSNNY